MKIKGLKRISKDMEKWANKNGFEVRVKYGKEFLYNPNNQKIKWSPIMTPSTDKQFRKFAKTYDKECEVNDFVLAFLHEIGHYNTLEVMPKGLHKISRLMQRAIEKIPNTKICNYLYFRLPHERVATKWAVDFAKENPKEIEKLNKKLYKSFKNFYEKNEIGD